MKSNATRTEVRKCPECGSGAVRRSQMRGFLERGILRPVGLRAFRCESCDARHYGFERIEEKRLAS
jgi:transcriptional regulator NrdR family protein